MDRGIKDVGGPTDLLKPHVSLHGIRVRGLSLLIRMLACGVKAGRRLR